MNLNNCKTNGSNSQKVQDDNFKVIDYSRIDDLKVVFQQDFIPEISQTQKYFGVKNDVTTYYENEKEPVVGTSLIIQVELSSDDDSDSDHCNFKGSDNVFTKIDEIENPESRKTERIKVIGKTNFQYVLKRRAWLSKRKTNELKMQNYASKNLKFDLLKLNKESIGIKKEEFLNQQKSSKTKRQKANMPNGNGITMKYEIMADESNNKKDDDPVQRQEITDSSH